MVRSRTGRVIIPAWQKRQPRVQPRKISTLIRSCTDLGQRHERRLRVGPLVEVHDRALADPRRDVVPGARDRGDGAVRAVGDGVEARHVDAVDAGQAGQQLDAAAGAALRPSRP